MTGPSLVLKASLIAAILLGATLPLVGAQTSTTASSPMVTFDHKTGNEWWVEVIIGGPLAPKVVKVESMDAGGPWVGLTKRSWGAWAASFHIQPGNLVKFRATTSDGSSIQSCWFTHPAGVEQCGASQPFAANFVSPRGNNWWIQTKVDANRPLAGVDARVNGGTWNPLKLQSWAEWAASFHMPTGSKVQLRARATDGSFDVHHHGYVWPEAAPYPMLGAVPDIRFENVRGNAWWQQVNVYSNMELISVEVRINTGAWQPMKLQSYGDWTSAHNAPAGSIVQFRATSSGEAIASGCFRWTAATPTPCADSGTWPKEGSFVVYSTHSSSGVPGYYRITDSTVNLVYRNGAWSGTCQGTTEEGRENNEGDGYDVTYENFTETVTMRPLIQTDGGVGETIVMPYIDRCMASSQEGQATPDGTHAMKNLGAVITLGVERGAEEAGTDAYQDILSYADRNTGLALYWDHWHLHSRDHGEVTGTDAPLGPILTPAQQRAIQGTWPVEGSYVSQTWCKQDSEYGHCTMDDWTTQRYVFRSGAWVGDSCIGMIGGVEVNQKPTGTRPALGPATASVGSTVTVDRLEGCGMTTTQMKVQPTMAVATNVGGCCPYEDPTFVEAWMGVTPSGSTPEREGGWDVESRLLLGLDYGDQSMWIEESDIRLV